MKKLKSYEITTCPFAEVPEYNKPSRFRPNPPKATVTWVKPKLVAEIAYRELTSSGAIRQPSFKGLREDKKPSEVIREIPKATTSLLQEHNLVKQKIITAPPKQERKTFLNPKEETQTRIIGAHELKFTNLSKVFWAKEGYTKKGYAELLLPGGTLYVTLYEATSANIKPASAWHRRRKFLSERYKGQSTGMDRKLSLL